DKIAIVNMGNLFQQVAQKTGVSNTLENEFKGRAAELQKMETDCLKRPIEQLKTALFYPDGGLPLLMTGESGTGKSYLAQLMHEYA
ncbi:sigma 54-interacting transcriptional regulator, partial [Salmonella enterica subsp. enterica serovar Montevideo]|nr:sigma 54-interacting transcriptional regulator [Salmonella enterica subsp. enterica serovar Montevideo]